MPVDFGRRAEGYELGERRLALGSALAERLRRRFDGQRYPQFLTMSAIFGVLLYRYFGIDDLIFGCADEVASSGDGGAVHRPSRQRYPLRLRLRPTDRLTDLVRNLREQYERDARYRGIRGVEAFRRRRSHKATDLNVVVEPAALELSHQLAEVQIEQVEMDPGGSGGDLWLLVDEAGSGLPCLLRYNARRFPAWLADQLCRHLLQLAAVALSDPTQQIGRLDLLCDGERDLLLASSCGPKEAPAHADGLLDRIGRQANERPEHPALVFGELQLSYRQLHDAASSMAARLRARGLAVGDLVLVCLERSALSVAALLGTMMAGGVYIPVLPETPDIRLRDIVGSCAPILILTEEHRFGRFVGIDRACASRLVAVATLDSACERVEGDLPRLSPGDAAYVIYTSGSTGKPKGVICEHGSLANTVLHQVDELGLSHQDRYLQFFAFSFDGSLADVFAALVSGATLVLCPAEARADGGQLVRFLREQRITSAALPPSAIAILERARIPSLRLLLTAGERAKSGDVRHYARRCRVVNAYGPTEASVMATGYVVDPDRVGDDVPIGKPIRNLRAYVLDPSLRLVPFGVDGELCLAGIGVARGYLNEPELTRRRFVENPFNPSERMYRTGDLVRRQPDGNLEFVGRVDRQLKVRGFRVEPEEIEAALQANTDIEAAAVIAAGEHERAALVAYLVPRSGRLGIDLDQVREVMKRALPDYMIPSRYVSVAALPTTSHGKVDRERLTALTRIDRAPVRDGAERPMTERWLLSIWRDLLGPSEIGRDDNFFTVGGHSLLAAQLIARINAELPIQLPVGAIYDHPTLTGLAAEVARRQRG